MNVIPQSLAGVIALAIIFFNETAQHSIAFNTGWGILIIMLFRRHHHTLMRVYQA